MNSIEADHIAGSVNTLAAATKSGGRIIWVVLMAVVLIGVLVWNQMSRTAQARTVGTSADTLVRSLVSSEPDSSTAPGAEGGPPDPQAVIASEDAADAAAANAASPVLGRAE